MSEQNDLLLNRVSDKLSALEKRLDDLNNGTNKRIDDFRTNASFVISIIGLLMALFGAGGSYILKTYAEKTARDTFVTIEKEMQQKEKEFETKVDEELNKISLEVAKARFGSEKINSLLNDAVRNAEAGKQLNESDRSLVAEIDKKLESSLTAHEWFLIGYDAIAKKEYENAKEYLTNAIELNPSDAENYDNRGLAYFALKEYDKALADYEKAVQLDPANNDAKQHLKEATEFLQKPR